MEFLIVRHGRPEHQAVDDGAADPELNELGRMQSEALAEYLSTLSIDHIASSPMRRARQTGEPLAARLGMEIEIVDALKESDFEATEYKPLEDHRDEHIEAFRNDPDHIFGSAGREAFFARTIGAFVDLASAHAGKTVVVFCHGMVTAAWLCHVTGQADPFQLAPDYTGLTRVRGSANRDVYSMRSFNETMHLKDLPDVRW